jgi:hypothetical protein
MNSKAYNALHVIHESTEQIVQQVEYLRDEGLLTDSFAAIHKLAAEQNCSQISLSTLLALEPQEQQNAATLEKQRRAKEEPEG